MLAGIAGGSVTWAAARLTSYGPVEGTQLPTLSFTPLTAEHLAWRGKWRDVTGDFYWGARPYDARHRAFIAFDTAGHAATPDGYSAFGGNPVMLWDPDARCNNTPSANVPMVPWPDSALDLEIDDTLRNLQTINTGYALRREAQEAYAADQVNRALWDYQLNQQIDHMWDQTPQRAYAGAAWQQETERLRYESTPTPDLSWSQQWRYDPTGTFDNALATTANIVTLGTANSASIAFSGSDLWGKGGYSTGQRATEGLFLVSMIAPAGGLGLRAEEGLLGAAEGLGRYEVGSYNVLREGAEAGLDAHHVGQKALMRQFVEGYDLRTAPSILVPKAGHTRGADVLSRNMSGFNNARDVIARDIWELRRVILDIPNSQLQRLIELNKQMYPEVRR